jgi:hypothetical protein
MIIWCPCDCRPEICLIKTLLLQCDVANDSFLMKLPLDFFYCFFCVKIYVEVLFECYVTDDPLLT